MRAMAFDVGTVRVGVAYCIPDTTIAVPFITLPQNSDVFETISIMCEQHDITHLVVGLPRSMDSHETSQTAYSREFAVNLAKNINLPITMQDESVTSIRAEEILKLGKKPYQKADIDSMAAKIILDDYLAGLDR